MNNPNIVKMISVKIKKYCFKNNISLNEFALRCELTYSTVYHIVMCHNKNVTDSTIFNLSKGMNLTLSEFFQDAAFEQLNDIYS